MATRVRYAAPPADDGGSRGSFTRPDEELEVDPPGEADSANPAPSQSSGSAVLLFVTLAVIAVLALITAAYWP
jgi:hypothetical protein